MLDEQKVDLSSVLNFKVGDTLMLNATPDSLVQLRAGAVPLTYGRMGRRNHNIDIVVDRLVIKSGIERRAIQSLITLRAVGDIVSCRLPYSPGSPVALVWNRWLRPGSSTTSAGS